MEEVWVVAEVRDDTHVQLLGACEGAAEYYAMEQQRFGSEDLQRAVDITPRLVADVERWLLLQPEEGFQCLLEEAVMMGKQLAVQLLLRMFVPAHAHADALARAIERLLVHCTTTDTASGPMSMDLGSSNRLRNLLLQMARCSGGVDDVLYNSAGDALPLCVLNPSQLLWLLLPFASSNVVFACMIGPVCDQLLGLRLLDAHSERAVGVLHRLEMAVEQSYESDRLHAQAIWVLETAYMKIALDQQAKADATGVDVCGEQLWVAKVMRNFVWRRSGKRLELDSLSLADALDSQVRMRDVVAFLHTLVQEPDGDMDIESDLRSSTNVMTHIERHLSVSEIPLHRTVRYVAAVAGVARRWSSAQFSHFSRMVLADHAQLLGMHAPLLVLPKGHCANLAETGPCNNSMLLLGVCVIAVRIQSLRSADVLSAFCTARFVQLAMNDVDDELLRQADGSIDWASERGKHFAVVLSLLLSQAQDHLPSSVDRVFLTLHGCLRAIREAGHVELAAELAELVTTPQAS